MTISNRLHQETSPYLLQHAENPVHWQPWDQAALTLSRKLNKPILLSIGYSACHWCHVMAHESFADTETASFMNELFINIKVDKEERPDIDKIYQLAHAAITRRTGGWPLTMFLTPDRVPFFGGTYFPLEARYGMPAFKDILKRISQYCNEQRDEIHKQNQSLQQFFNSLHEPQNEVALNDNLIRAIFDQVRLDLAEHFDAANGGFGQSPKFPHTPSIERALSQWHRSKKKDSQSLHIARFTLDKMSAGGIYDHIGGGFFRYSVDEQWMIPHFEKMLYDNGPLLSLYARAWASSQNANYKRTSTETADWVIREMQAHEGAYYSTLDADSEGEEGKYYIWNQSEIGRCLNEKEYSAFAPLYRLNEPANFEGSWHLHINAANQVNDESDKTILQRAKEKLFNERQNKVPPGRDEKILTAWNGLMIKGMAQAGRYLNQKEYTHSAIRALTFIIENMFIKQRLYASYKDGTAKHSAYLDDYAFLLDGILELLQSQWNQDHLEFSSQIANVLLTHFEDKDSGGFYFTSDDHEKLLYRPKSLADESMPSGAAIAAYSLNRLGHLLGEPNYIRVAERAVASAQNEISQSTLAHCSYILALEEIVQAPKILILRCKKNTLEQWATLSSSYYHPHNLLFIISDEKSETPLQSYINEKTLHGEQSLYICTGKQCSTAIRNKTDIKDALIKAYQ